MSFTRKIGAAMIAIGLMGVGRHLLGLDQGDVRWFQSVGLALYVLAGIIMGAIFSSWHAVDE